MKRSVLSILGILIFCSFKASMQNIFSCETNLEACGIAETSSSKNLIKNLQNSCSNNTQFCVNDVESSKYQCSNFALKESIYSGNMATDPTQCQSKQLDNTYSFCKGIPINGSCKSTSQCGPNSYCSSDNLCILGAFENDSCSSSILCQTNLYCDSSSKCKRYGQFSDGTKHSNRFYCQSGYINPSGYCAPMPSLTTLEILEKYGTKCTYSDGFYIDTSNLNIYRSDQKYVCPLFANVSAGQNFFNQDSHCPVSYPFCQKMRYHNSAYYDAIVPFYSSYGVDSNFLYPMIGNRNNYFSMDFFGCSHTTLSSYSQAYGESWNPRNLYSSSSGQITIEFVLILLIFTIL